MKIKIDMLMPMTFGSGLDTRVSVCSVSCQEASSSTYLRQPWAQTHDTRL